jgi:hypothetical protein
MQGLNAVPGLPNAKHVSFFEAVDMKPGGYWMRNRQR